MMQRPTPIARPGLDILAQELHRFIELNGALEQENHELRLKIRELERILESYINSPSGSNNVVLP